MAYARPLNISIFYTLEDFWRNYYLRIRLLRKKSGIEGKEEQKIYQDINDFDIVHTFSALTKCSNVNEIIDYEPLDTPIEIDPRFSEFKEAEINLKKEVRYIIEDFTEILSKEYFLKRSKRSLKLKMILI